MDAARFRAAEPTEKHSIGKGYVAAGLCYTKTVTFTKPSRLENIRFLWWRFRVCWVGLKWHRIWVWNHIDTWEWLEYYTDQMTPEDQYIEGWCRE